MSTEETTPISEGGREVSSLPPMGARERDLVKIWGKGYNRGLPTYMKERDIHGVFGQHGSLEKFRVKGATAAINAMNDQPSKCVLPTTSHLHNNAYI